MATLAKAPARTPTKKAAAKKAVARKAAIKEVAASAATQGWQMAIRCEPGPMRSRKRIR